MITTFSPTKIHFFWIARKPFINSQKDFRENFIPPFVAELYGVETRDINKAVKNNPGKFPNGYIFELTTSEKTEVVEIFHHLSKLRFSTQLPKAFTEKGLYMLATILKSPKAVETTIAIVEAYAKLKELSRVIVEIPQQEDDKTLQQTFL